MANVKILSHKVKVEQRKAHYLVVSVPLKNSIVIMKNQSIGEAEMSFISKRDKENDHSKKVEYDRVRALLKWAGCCNAILLEMHNGGHNGEHKLMLSLAFPNMKDMYVFEDSMVTNVDGATGATMD